MATLTKSAMAMKTREAGKEEGNCRGNRAMAMARKTAIASYADNNHNDGNNSNNSNYHDDNGVKDKNNDDNADNDNKDNND
jgi:hypothetical protein